MRRLSLFALLAGCAGPRPAGDLNATVLEVLREYPTDGSYGYWWPKGSSWEGTTRDIVYQGRRLCTGDPQKRSYCCGLVFEVYMKACERAIGAPLRIRTLTADDLHEMRLRFFGDSKTTGDRRRLVQAALVSMGLGTAVERLEDARAGDFVQFWRHDGSGHQAVFIDWVRDPPSPSDSRQGEPEGLRRAGDGRIVAIKYWSSQKSTNGINYTVERIEERGVKRDEIYIVRARL